MIVPEFAAYIGLMQALVVSNAPSRCKASSFFQDLFTVDLAPEVIKRSTTDHRVDLFALGCTAFEIFTGQLPWEKSLNSDETVRRRLNSPPRQAKALKPDMVDELARILMKSIEIDRKGRFATAAEFKETLQGMAKVDY